MKELLKQYNDLTVEIKEIKARISRIESIKIDIERDSVKGSSPQFPYGERSFIVEGYNTQKSDKKEFRLKILKRTLQERLEKCEDLKLQIEQFINEIPDSRTRRVFQYRYIDDMEWLPIAFRIGKSDESYPRKMIHDKYLESLED